MIQTIFEQLDDLKGGRKKKRVSALTRLAPSMPYLWGFVHNCLEAVFGDEVKKRLMGAQCKQVSHHRLPKNHSFLQYHQCFVLEFIMATPHTVYKEGNVVQADGLTA